jgi:hypothetical protein
VPVEVCACCVLTFRPHKYINSTMSRPRKSAAAPPPVALVKQEAQETRGNNAYLQLFEDIRTKELARLSQLSSKAALRDLETVIRPLWSKATETVRRKKLITTKQPDGSTKRELSRYSTKIKRIDDEHSAAARQHIEQLLKMNSKSTEQQRTDLTEALILLKQLQAYNVNPDKLHKQGCIPAWYQELTGISNCACELIDVSAEDDEVTECVIIDDDTEGTTKASSGTKGMTARTITFKRERVELQDDHITVKRELDEHQADDNMITSSSSSSSSSTDNAAVMSSASTSDDVMHTQMVADASVRAVSAAAAAANDGSLVAAALAAIDDTAKLHQGVDGAQSDVPAVTLAAVAAVRTQQQKAYAIASSAAAATPPQQQQMPRAQSDRVAILAHTKKSAVSRTESSCEANSSKRKIIRSRIGAKKGKGFSSSGSSNDAARAVEEGSSKRSSRANSNNSSGADDAGLTLTAASARQPAILGATSRRACTATDTTNSSSNSSSVARSEVSARSDSATAAVDKTSSVLADTSVEAVSLAAVAEAAASVVLQGPFAAGLVITGNTTQQQQGGCGAKKDVPVVAAAVSAQQQALQLQAQHSSSSSSGSVVSSAVSTAAVVSSTTVSNVSATASVSQSVNGELDLSTQATPTDTAIDDAHVADTETLQKLVLYNGATYFGFVTNGQPNGHGTEQMINGSTYTGSWLHGTTPGHGTLVTVHDGILQSTYIGKFCHGKQQGQGQRVLATDRTKSSAIKDCDGQVQATSRSVAQHQYDAAVQQCGDTVNHNQLHDSVAVVPSQVTIPENIGTDTSATSHTSITIPSKIELAGTQLLDNSESVKEALPDDHTQSCGGACSVATSSSSPVASSSTLLQHAPLSASERKRKRDAAFLTDAGTSAVMGGIKVDTVTDQSQSIITHSAASTKAIMTPQHDAMEVTAEDSAITGSSAKVQSYMSPLYSTYSLCIM